jgi:hypothetical protein
VTVIFFAGPRLDHGDADQSSSVEADYLERRDARPPVVVRGFSVSGHPVSVIRAGERVADAVRVTDAGLSDYGFTLGDDRAWWRYPAREPSGNAVEGITRQAFIGTNLAPPPFSFRPHAVLPMPNGWLFCLAAPLVNSLKLAAMGSGPAQEVFREYYRVYRRNGDWVQDFPDLHDAPIHDAHWDDAGNCFIAGDEVGEERYSFRKYNSAYTLQWSVSFKDYWPLSTVAVRTTQEDFNKDFAQFGQRRASVRIEPAGDGSFYVISEIAWTFGATNSSGFRFYRRPRRFTLVARVSALGVILWVRVLERKGRLFHDPNGEPSRHGFSCKALDSNQLCLFFVEAPPGRYSVGEVGGDYSWDYLYQVYKTNSEWTYQELYDNAYVDIIDWQNGLLVNADGTLSGHLFAYEKIVLGTVTKSQGVVLESSVVYPKTLIHSVMRYADERLTVWSRRIRYGGAAGDLYNVDPEYVKHVFYKDLTLLSEAETPAFDHLEAVTVAEDGSVYRGTRIVRDYGPGSFFWTSDVIYLRCATHFKAVNSGGDPLWDTLAASGGLGINNFGEVWRENGYRFYKSPPLDPERIAEYQEFHDDLVQYTTAHDKLASADVLGIRPNGTDFWLPATDIVIAYDSPTPALALPVFLKRPDLIGPRTTLPPGLVLRFGLPAPLVRREYVGPLAAQVYRLTLGDLEIPFSHLSARKTAFEVTVSAICPAASEPLVAAILARDTDTLTVWRGVRFPDGAEQLDPLLRGALAGIRYDRGARSGSITLDLRQEPAATPARIRTLAAVSRRDARSWSSPLPDIFLNPGDTAVVGLLSFTVGSVDYLISPTEARMTVGEQT